MCVSECLCVYARICVYVLRQFVSALLSPGVLWYVPSTLLSTPINMYIDGGRGWGRTGGQGWRRVSKRAKGECGTAHYTALFKLRCAICVRFVFVSNSRILDLLGIGTFFPLLLCHEVSIQLVQLREPLDYLQPPLLLCQIIVAGVANQQKLLQSFKVSQLQ